MRETITDATLSPSFALGNTRLFTAADLAHMPDELPSGPVKWELDNGRMIAMPPPGDEHAVIQANVISHLKWQGDFRQHGETRGEGMIVLARNPDVIRAPDASFIRTSRLPAQTSPEGYLVTLPDLAVEIRSPNDTLAELQRKTELYLAAGIAVVWVVDPIGRQVIESRLTNQHVWMSGDTIPLEDVIPGFTLPVADLFR
jgi:Uma2 family endonuclease